MEFEPSSRLDGKAHDDAPTTLVASREPYGAVASPSSGAAGVNDAPACNGAQQPQGNQAAAAHGPAPLQQPQQQQQHPSSAVAIASEATTAAVAAPAPAKQQQAQPPQQVHAQTRNGDGEAAHTQKEEQEKEQAAGLIKEQQDKEEAARSSKAQEEEQQEAARRREELQRLRDSFASLRGRGEPEGVEVLELSDLAAGKAGEREQQAALRLMQSMPKPWKPGACRACVPACVCPPAPPNSLQTHTAAFVRATARLLLD